MIGLLGSRFEQCTCAVIPVAVDQYVEWQIKQVQFEKQFVVGKSTKVGRVAEIRIEEKQTEAK